MVATSSHNQVLRVVKNRVLICSPHGIAVASKIKYDIWSTADVAHFIGVVFHFLNSHEVNL